MFGFSRYRRFSSLFNSRFDYQQLTSEYLEDAVDLLKQSFCRDENFCSAVKMSENPAAMNEFLQIPRLAAKDGVSLIAIDKETSKVAAVLINKIRVLGDEDDDFDKYVKSCKHPESKTKLQFMSDTDKFCNLFNFCKVDCLAEMMFMNTLPQFRQHRLSTEITVYFIELMKKLRSGVNIKQSIDGTKLDINPVPEAISVITSTVISQRTIGQLGFQTAAEMQYKDVKFGEENMAALIKGTPSMLIQYMKI